MIASLLERPGVLLSLFLAVGLGVGGTFVHLTSAPAKQPRTFQHPPDHLRCGYAVSEWLREHGRDED
jgi:hypothetical protein